MYYFILDLDKTYHLDISANTNSDIDDTTYVDSIASVYIVCSDSVTLDIFVMSKL